VVNVWSSIKIKNKKSRCRVEGACVPEGGGGGAKVQKSLKTAVNSLKQFETCTK
jgi:hypothetical protein